MRQLAPKKARMLRRIAWAGGYGQGADLKLRGAVRNYMARSAAGGFGSFEPGRGKWQVYPSGFRCR